MVIYERQDNVQRAELLRLVLITCNTDGQSIHPEFRGPFGMLFSSGCWNCSSPLFPQEHEIDEPFIDSDHPDLLHIGL